MTQPARPRSPRRSNAEYRWSGPRIHAFLRALAGSGSVAAAARVVGVSRQSAYRRRFGAEFGAAMRRSGLRYDAQGDTFTPQGDIGAGQSDTCSAQGDTFRAESDTFRPQGGAK